MGKYANNPDAVAALIRDTEVHRDVYIDEEVFRFEMKYLFPSTWVYVGHESQVPEAGDFITTEIGLQPLLMVRHTDGEIYLLHNRCMHKGVKIATNRCGNTGRRFRCPYHAWSYRTDGRLLSLPLQKGYDDTGFDRSEAAKGLPRVEAVKNYRGFVFARLNDEGISFEEFFGESLSSFDNMVDRSPAGKLEVAGPPLRYMHNCNWKMLVENQTDTCHPMVAHESSAGTTVELWNQLGMPPDARKPMAVEVIVPFMSSYEMFEDMGIRVWPNGHGHTGVHHSIHSNYSSIPGYYDQMVAAYGEERTQAILGENRHNTVYFPNIMIKGPIQLLRVFTPLAANRTLVDSYIYRLVDAPDMLLERTAMYNRLINAPTSVVGHDDLEMYERAQQGLLSDGSEWVNIQRLYRAGEEEDVTVVENGTTERQMRNQFHAWKKFILSGMHAQKTGAAA
jgi:phenylpropionate dioxygenase-like ring-hydroxylating dioxygenase large terminal subunit